MGGVVAACPVPIFITFSSVCEQIKDMPVSFALWEQVLGAVNDVLDQALRLFFLAAGVFQSCRRFVQLASEILDERKAAEILAGRRFQVFTISLLTRWVQGCAGLLRERKHCKSSSQVSSVYTQASLLLGICACALVHASVCVQNVVCPFSRKATGTQQKHGTCQRQG